VVEGGLVVSHCERFLVLVDMIDKMEKWKKQYLEIR
jgi:hypothetical protein